MSTSSVNEAASEFAVTPEMMHRAARLKLTLMLALTFGTGVVDAVGYLGLDRVFTGNMTGNVVLLGMAFVGTTELPVLGPFLALVGFMGGAFFAGVVLRRALPGQRWVGLLGVSAALLVCVTVLSLLAPDPIPHRLAVVMTTVMAVAMGMQAAAARFVAVKDISTVVVTSTITGLAADAALGLRGSELQMRRLLAVSLMCVGALAGAALLQWSLAAGLALGSGVLVCVFIAAVRYRAAWSHEHRQTEAASR